MRVLLGLCLLCPVSVCHGQNKPIPQAGTIAKETGRKADVESALSQICPTKDLVREANASVSGCNGCPKETAFYGNSRITLDIYRVTFGHFTSPNSDDLILDGAGCDPHSMNFGGSFVFSFSSGKPRLLKYNQGLMTDQCYEFSRADQQEFLVCKGQWGGQGEGDEYVFMAAFGADGKATSATVFSTRENIEPCDDPTGKIDYSNIQDIQFVTRESGELASMTIMAAQGAATRAQDAAARKEKKLPASVKTYPIEFLFDGKQFKVAPASRAALSRFPQNR